MQKTNEDRLLVIIVTRNIRLKLKGSKSSD